MPRYPESPGFEHVDTSIEAADSVEPTAESMRLRVLHYVRQVGTATSDEVEVALNMIHQTASARIRELVLMERLYATGEKRKTRQGRNARVYAVAPPQVNMDELGW